MRTQRKIHHLLASNDKMGREFRYLLHLNPRHSFDWSKPVWVTDKIDGCLHYLVNVMTEQGSIQIGKIVNQRLPVLILSYNPIKRVVEFRRITHYHKEPIQHPFISIGVQSRLRGNRPKHIVCTANHKFYAKGEWIEAADLGEGNVVSHLGNNLSVELKQLILGTLLGDGSIRKSTAKTRSFQFTHSMKQDDYFEYKKMLLGNIFYEMKGSRGGFEGSLPNRRGSSVVNGSITDLIMGYCEKDGGKYVTEEWINEITPVGLAFWYMDDGSIMQNGSQRPRVRFHTNSYSLDEVNRLKRGLKRKYNIDSTVANYKGWTLSLTADGSENFFNLIFPFICDSMKYKIPERYRNYPCVFSDALDTPLGLLDAKVLSVSSELSKESQRYLKYQYDLEIEGNSNYFANSILVHNTTTQADCLAVFQRRDRFKAGDDRKFAASDQQRYYTQQLDKWDPANKWVFEACRRYLPAIQNMPSSCTAYFECFGERIQARYRGWHYHDIRVFDFTEFDFFFDAFADVVSYAKRLEIPVVGHTTRTFHGIAEIIAALPDAQHRDPDLSQFELEGWVIRQGDQIAKIRKKDLTRLIDTS